MRALGLIGPKADRLNRTLRLASFMDARLAVPSAHDLEVDAGLLHDGDDLGNNSIGLCALAGPGHFERWMDKLLGLPEEVTANVVKGEYSQLSGWHPDLPDSDVGLYAIDVMNAWRTRGLFGGRKIRAWGQLNQYDPGELQRAAWCLGGVFLSLALPMAAMSSDVWDSWTDDGGPAGNHLVWVDATSTCNSWGQKILITPRFITQRCFEAIGVVSERALNRDGRAFSGLDLAGLDAALASVTRG